MKKALTIMIGVLFLTSIGSAQPQRTAATLGVIRQQYRTINSRSPKYRQVKKDLEGYSTEGGELVAYFEGAAIVKLAAQFYGECGRAAEEYYYQDGHLIFVFRKDSYYSKCLTGKVVKVEEQRFYFNNGALITWINEKGKRVIAGEEFAKKEEEYLSSSRELTVGARSPKDTIEATNN
ncbi:MAG TPA: hypothetical protein VJS64_02785 [Pyrinomonadaceae bacterium]|nr:hypothetical protein [Pyrinomonadaceae bacterium]